MILLPYPWRPFLAVGPPWLQKLDKMVLDMAEIHDIIGLMYKERQLWADGPFKMLVRMAGRDSSEISGAPNPRNFLSSVYTADCACAAPAVQRWRIYASDTVLGNAAKVGTYAVVCLKWDFESLRCVVG